VNDPELVPRGSLNGVDVGLSVSDSADLGVLGLTSKHAELAIGELARAVLVAGGNLTYGGRIKPSGFTQLFMHEVRRYGQSRHSFTICLALPEHRRLTLAEIDELDRSLGTAGRLVCLDADGRPVDYRLGRATEAEDITSPERTVPAYSGLRRYMTSATSARVAVGGQLAGFKGDMPGVIEEVIGCVDAQKPVYLAGGMGGATAAAVKALGIDDLAWAPAGFPQADGEDPRVAESLSRLRHTATQASFDARDNGLTAEELLQLSSSHRPGEIASLVAIGLSRYFDVMPSS
jgi:SLOG-like protein